MISSKPATRKKSPTSFDSFLKYYFCIISTMKKIFEQSSNANTVLISLSHREGTSQALPRHKGGRNFFIRTEIGGGG